MQLFDWSQGLPDKTWLGSTRQVANYVAPKGDSGLDQLSIAPGGGRAGKDCLLVTSPDARAGLPGFWVLRGCGNGKGSVANLSTNDGYLAGGQRANRLSFWVRFDEGFRAASSVKTAQNFNVGTYHFDPAKKGIRKESNGWHFYHQLVVRHDLAAGEWVHVVLNEIPQHQRGRSKYAPPPNPTQDAGDYWDLLTRFYVDCHPYFGDAEKQYPVRMLVDGISLYQVSEQDQVACRIAPPRTPVVAGKTSTMAVTLRNKSRASITGVVGHRSHYTWTPSLMLPESGKSVHRQKLTLPPGDTQLEFCVTPRIAMPAGSRLQHSIVFVPEQQLRPNGASMADPRVCLSESYGVSGPCDSSPASDVITLTTQ